MAFDVGGAKEIVSPIFGKLIAPYEVQKMKQELVKMLSDPVKSNRYIEELDEFSWEKASEKYLKEIG